MCQKVLINDMEINASNVQVGTVTKNGKKRRQIQFDFKVRSEDYHDVTTLLYKNNFQVTVPDENITFPAVITNYATSITNLYETGQTGDFSLELTGKE
ncbi:DUF3219 family protein [Lentibacillus juripiscarius]|uniref:DUF3219 family protein n=1 Tax=Lentibacillus juripiscarius TaxID=257446 RepID=A0ABW5V3C0_9BACI